jgi:hypothetical protein
MVLLPTWIPGVVVKLIERLWPKRPSLTIQIQQVCFGSNLASLEADFSDYRIDLYLFLYVWAVNTNEVPTMIRDWNLHVLADDREVGVDGERVEDISNWQQHSTEHAVQHGFPVVRDIRQPTTPFPPQPLQQGIPVEGWVCFLVRETRDSLMAAATVTLTATDSFGDEHPVSDHAPWTCKGGMVNTEMPF